MEINQCVGCTRKFFTKSFLGDDAAVLARSSGEEPASPRRWRGGRRDDSARTRRKISISAQVCALEKERERNLHACDAFVVNVDTKWSTHGPFDDDRATWRGADWTRDLYLLAISKDASLKSMRDLRGPDGAGLCRAMRAALLRCAADVYGVPATKLRVFFHYQPQFYRLHAHCTRAEHTNPGCECDRAHLLTTVAANLDLAPDYYARAPLTYKLRLGEKLHGLLSAGA